MLDGVDFKVSKKIMFAVVVYIALCLMLNMYLIRTGGMGEKLQAKSSEDQLVDGVYFTTTTLSTVGYGDIAPQTPFAKCVVAVEQLSIFAVGLGLISFAVST